MNEEHYKELAVIYGKMARETRIFLDAFKEHGFTEYQAFTILAMYISNAAKLNPKAPPDRISRRAHYPNP